MTPSINALVWRQFAAAIDMLENALEACPTRIWDEEPRFYQLAHHTAFFLDYYLSNSPREVDYIPPSPFTRSEFEDDTPPVRHSKEELMKYLRLGRQRLRNQLMRNTTDQLTAKRFVSEYKDFSLFELLLYNMRHVQHHAAQLNMLLRQDGIVPPKWVSKTKEELR
jgi:hypothetical protein